MTRPFWGNGRTHPVTHACDMSESVGRQCFREALDSSGGESVAPLRAYSFHPSSTMFTAMSGVALMAGTALILSGLWHRDRERLALGLFVAGAVLVVLAGVIALPTIMAP
jgi:hypothetical protein